MKFLSIQSAVAYGHVGNSAAMFPLQRIGVEVMPVFTVYFSNHTGYGDWTGRALSADEVIDIVDGVERRGGLDGVDAVLSGYLGGSGIGDAVLETVGRVKQRNPEAIYACDPVMGNIDTGCVVSPEIHDLFRDRVIPHADVITPNQFELGYLTGTDPDTVASTLEAVDRVISRGPSTVLVTSLKRPDRPEGTIEMLAATSEEAWIVQTPLLDTTPSGSGDVTAALFSAHLRRTGDLADSLSRTTASVYELLENTMLADSRELRLVESQEAYVAPQRTFDVRRVR
ncbi:pyridoxal kinase PdxY [Leucobacter sp. GX24907]